MSDLWFGTSGPHDAKIVVVGEAWGMEEAAAKQPFVGGAGNELGRMLAEAGISRGDCLMTNVVASRPMNNEMWRFFYAKDSAPAGSELRGLHPTRIVVEGVERLASQILAHPRRLVLGCGNYPLWALSNCTGYDIPGDAEGRRCPNGIMNWRGSMWFCETVDPQIPLLPIIHPSAILRQWSNRAVTVHDLKARVPLALTGDWRHANPPFFWAPPTFDQAILKLKSWLALAEAGPLRLVCDIETAKQHITCIGFADSPNFAMVIPFVADGQLTSYWTLDEEIELITLMRKVFLHPNILVEGQNFIYDQQYILAYLAVLPRLDADSMLMHHLLWPGTPKGLDYLSSLYCHYHWYWKEDGKEWDTRGELADLLAYNGWDCVRTYEVITALRTLIPQLGLAEQWEETKARADLALRMMLRGINIDRKKRGELKIELAGHLSRVQAELEDIIPQAWLPEPKKGAKRTPWYRSPKQQQFVFGDILGMRIPKHRKTGNPTLGKDALMDLPNRYPEWKGLFTRLEQARSVSVFQSHFIDAPLELDGRMRCSFNPAGTETFRWSSSKNAFRRGTNLQNIPRGDEE